jgi:hypothetical protein
MSYARSRHALVLATALLLCLTGAASGQGQNRGPSPAFQAELRKTLEQRRARRTRTSVRPPNAVIPWPMPPVLIIRATPEVHDEIESLLGKLRYYP